jgi:hypothetical protein
MNMQNNHLPPSPSFPEPTFHLTEEYATDWDGTEVNAPQLLTSPDDHWRGLRNSPPITPITFDAFAREEARRFLIVDGDWGPPNLPGYTPIDVDDENRDRLRAERQALVDAWYADREVMPLPVSFLDVSPLGKGCTDLYAEPLRTRDEALALAASLNRQLLESVGRSLTRLCGLDFEWHMVVEVSRVVDSHMFPDMENGFGKMTVTENFMVRMVIPTDEERAAHLIDWSVLPDGPTDDEDNDDEGDDEDEGDGDFDPNEPSSGPAVELELVTTCAQ